MERHKPGGRLTAGGPHLGSPIQSSPHAFPSNMPWRQRMDGHMSHCLVNQQNALSKEERRGTVTGADSYDSGGQGRMYKKDNYSTAFILNDT